MGFFQAPLYRRWLMQAACCSRRPTLSFLLLAWKIVAHLEQQGPGLRDVRSVLHAWRPAAVASRCKRPGKRHVCHRTLQNPDFFPEVVTENAGIAEVGPLFELQQTGDVSYLFILRQVFLKDSRASIVQLLPAAAVGNMKLQFGFGHEFRFP